MKYLFVSTIILIITLNCVKAQVEADYQALFNSWSNAYQKTYTSDQFQNAYQNFRNNLESINQHNAQMSNSPDGIIDNSPLNNANGPTVSEPKLDTQLSSLNAFSDLSYSQFVSMYTGGVPPAAASAGIATTTIIAIAAAIGGAILIAAAAVTAALVIRRKRSNKTKLLDYNSSQPQISSPTLVPPGSTNVFNLEPPHHSITARLFTGHK